MPVQLKRLLILGVVLFSVFLLFKYLLTPASFGQYGHYRGLALEENAALTAKYTGSEACYDCHDSIVAVKNEGLHSSIACESCHGPGFKHIEDPENEKMDQPDSREFCAHCHAFNKARPEKAITQQDIREHNPDEKCIECHNPHQRQQ